jgi:hypothetical protein
MFYLVSFSIAQAAAGALLGMSLYTPKERLVALLDFVF